MHSTDDFLILSEKIAEAVHEAIRGLVGTKDAGITLYIGADGTPTKRIDDAAEKAIFNVLGEEHTSFRIISEEAGEKIIGESPELSIIIDPIDGTYNAAVGIPFYSISLAITSVDLNDVIFGYVKNLATGDMFYAGVGEGAYFNGTRIHPSGTSNINKFCLSVYGYRHNTEVAANLAGTVRRIRTLGSVALDMCYVAAGNIDAFADVRGSMRMTDIAAAKLIIEESGGIVTSENGDSLKLENKLVNRVSVIASNGHAHDDILKLTTGIVYEDQ